MSEDSYLRHILCVILHYGSESDTNNCIRSLLNEKKIDIVISDNDPAQLYEIPVEFEDFVSVIKTGGFAGFSEGNNIGVDAFLSDNHQAILILNNDTIVKNGAINLMVNSLIADGVGAVGPCMPYAVMPSKVWACGGFINRLSLAIGGKKPKDRLPYEVDYLPGAAILCRAELWKKIGGFNEAYFLAYEEAEFCLEIKKQGYKVLVEPRAEILHKVGMSSQRKPEYFYNTVRNRLIFSKYLYGNLFGFVYGMAMTMILFKSKSLKTAYVKVSIWLKAIMDEYNDVKINRLIFTQIRNKYNNII